MTKTPQSYPPWIPNVLLALTASFFLLSIILGAALFVLARRSPQLEDLSAGDRQNLVLQASKIVPSVYLPFPSGGQMLFYRMMPKTHYVNVLNDTFTTNDL